MCALNSPMYRWDFGNSSGKCLQKINSWYLGLSLSASTLINGKMHFNLVETKNHIHFFHVLDLHLPQSLAHYNGLSNGYSSHRAPY